ncbi:unnamed protein product [Pleuronectes platessa]|uniref:Uncharacterized protein n=1 Tax=Pleuronectes platessa TaxID=8262 RepID=A0A9N7URN5_PLEPL|nr:unnamed protein product [Pleuronectes platessa]
MILLHQEETLSRPGAGDKVLSGQDVCPSIHSPVHLSSVHLSTCPPVHPFIHLSTCPPVHPFIHLSTCPSIHLSICPPVHLSICPSIHSSVHLSIYQPVHLSICPSVHSSKISPEDMSIERILTLNLVP